MSLKPCQACGGPVEPELRRRTYCRTCKRQKDRDYYERNSERIRARNMAFYLATPVAKRREQRKKWFDRNREAVLAAQARIRQMNPERRREIVRKSALKSLYGLPLEKYEEMHAEQSGRCAICGEVPPAGKLWDLHVDHDHVTGEIRGLLCGPCNRGLGCLRDDPARMRAAADYIERHMSQVTA